MRWRAQRLGHERFDLSAQVKSLLLEHSWPGNVRELGNVVEHALVLARGRQVALEHLPDELTTRPEEANPDVRRSLEEVERTHILAVLAACGGNQVEAARVLGVGRSTLWRKLQQYALSS